MTAGRPPPDTDRQSRSARLRGQQRPSNDRLVFSNRWRRSLSSPSPACRSPVRLAARGPLACSPPPPRVPAPPRFPAPDRARTAPICALVADGAAAAQAVAAPPRPNPSAHACRCRRRRRHRRRVSPRRHASLHLTALELCAETADGTLWQTEQRPPRRSLLRPVRIRPPARAAARRRRRSTRCPSARVS